MRPRRLARSLPGLVAIAVAIAQLVALDGLAQTATRTIRIEAVIVDPHGLAPESAFGGTITNAPETTWQVTTASRTQDVIVPTNLVHTVSATAPPAWSGWSLGGLKQVAKHTDGCQTSGYSGTIISVAAGTGSPKVCVRYNFTGGLLHVGVVAEPTTGHPPPTVSGEVRLGGQRLTSWQAETGAFAPAIGLAAGTYDVEAGSLPAGWSIVGWAAGTSAGSPACPGSASAYAAPTSARTIAAGQRTVVCLMVRYEPPPPATATLHIGVVRDASPGVPPPEGLGYGGTLLDNTFALVNDWGPIAFGEIASLVLAPGAYTATAASSGGWLPSGVATGSFPNGRPACPDDPASYAPFVAGVPLDLSAGTAEVVCFQYRRSAAAPTLAMANAPGSPAGGLARWEFTVTNTEGLDLPIELRTDAPTFVEAVGGSCTETDLSDGAIICTVPANATLAVTLGRPLPPRACSEQEVNATVRASLLPPARPTPEPFGDTLGGTAATAQTAAADPAACPVAVSLVAAFEGAPAPDPPDHPAFAFVPEPADGRDPAERCGPPAATPGEPSVLRWDCTLPPGWSGSVTATTPSGWQACDGDGPTPPADFRFRFCRLPTFEVRVVATNGDPGPARFVVRLAPSPAEGGAADLLGEASATEPAYFVDVPLADGYRLLGSPRFGFQLLGYALPVGPGGCPAEPAVRTGDGPLAVPAPPPGGHGLACVYYQRVSPLVVQKAAQPPVVTPSGAFRWVIDLAILEAPLPAALTLTDELSPAFTYGALSGPLAQWCRIEDLLLACELPAGTSPGNYDLAIPASAPGDTFSVCGVYRNTLRFAGGDTDAGEAAATVTVDCPSSGTLGFRAVVHGSAAPTATLEAVLTGPALPLPGEPVAVPTAEPARRTGLPAGAYTLELRPAAGYDLLGWSIGSGLADGAACPDAPQYPGALAKVTLSPGQPDAVLCFHLVSRVAIRVETVLNALGVNSPGVGWEFTLEGCGVGPLIGRTGVDGAVVFEHLPRAVGCSYTVTETAQAGWLPVTVSQTVAPANPGEKVVVRFVNIRVDERPCIQPNDPRCEAPPALTLPTTPTPVATPAGPAADQPAPASPTSSPAAGRTGGVALADPTPRPPATGTGAPTARHLPLLLGLFAFVAVASGLGTLALSRPRR